MLFLYLGIIVGLLFLLFWLCINCTVRNFRPEYSVGAAWWPRDSVEFVVNAPDEQAGVNAKGEPLYPFSSPKAEKEAFLTMVGKRPMRAGVEIVKG